MVKIFLVCIYLDLIVEFLLGFGLYVRKEMR